MADVIHRVELSLRSFYIFNSKFSVKENEEYKKILYYHPDDIELNTKLNDVGLSEGIFTFMGTFSDKSSCKALHTQKTTQLFFEAEPNYWMVMVINVPKEIRSKDGVEVADYRGGEVHDRIFRSILEQCYSAYRLFNGTFQITYDSAPTRDGANAQHAHLLQCLKKFFDDHLPTLNLTAFDVWDITRSIQYLPLDKFLFLRAHNFVNIICSTFPAVNEILFLYNDQVVCSGKINPTDVYSLHIYIVNTLLKPTHPGSVRDDFRNGRFITGDVNSFTKICPKVYLQLDDNVSGDVPRLQAFDFIVYRALNATLCLFVKDHKELPNDFYNELHTYMSSQLSSISRDINDTKSKQQQTSKKPAPSAESDEHAPKYLFINEQSLKHLSNISSDRRLPKAVQNMPTFLMNLIADLHGDSCGVRNQNESCAFEEVQVKTTNNFWIVKRGCNWRQYYVIIFSKASLLDVTYEAKRIFEQELTDDVFFDK